MTVAFEQAKGLDPLARAGTEPDINALTTEYQQAQEWGPSQSSGTNALSLAEQTRFNQWPGQTTDGLKWQRFQPAGSVVRPYDGRPDTRQPLVDAIINSLVDIDVVAFWNAQIKPSPTHATKLTAGQAAELRAVVRWMLKGPLLADLVDGVEYLSQVKNTLGWCVLHTTWKRKYGLRRERVTLEQLMESASGGNGVPEGSELAMLPELIMGKQTELTELTESGEATEGTEGTKGGSATGQDAAVDVLRKVYPYLKKSTAERIVRELREDGETEFLYREVQENRPCLEVLVPGLDVFLPEEVQDPREARVIFKRKYWNEVDVWAAGVNYDWSGDFIEAAVQTAGRVSQTGDAVFEELRDKNNRRIEIVTAYQRAVDDEDIEGIFCTEFSAQVGKDAEGNQLYGDYYLLDNAHGQMPFLFARTEVIGSRPDDARGVSTVLRTQQWELKRQRDCLHIRSELGTNPPRLKIGHGWSKAQEAFAPGAEVQNSVQGSALTYLAPPPDNGNLALGLCELIKEESEDYYGLARAKTESHPSRWQTRQARTTQRWLLTWGQALWQLAVLCYGTYETEELAAIIGRAPLLSAKDLLQHQINLDFDARTMDPEWLESVLKGVAQVRSFNTGGTIDDNKLVSFMLTLLDPTLAEEVTADQAGAANAIYQQVEHAIMAVMAGNKPQLSENDPTAGMKLQFAQQILQNNPEYQLQLTEKFPNGQPNPQFNRLRAQNLEVLLKNWQHNVQETQLSKMQGRLGVAEVNDAPVKEGSGY